MSIDVAVESYGPQILARYVEFLDRCDAHLLYHSASYLDFLQAVLDDSVALIIAASDAGRWVGTLIAYIRTTPLGAVLNALPYFGSHGDVLIANDAADPAPIVRALLDALMELCSQRSVGAINIVAHPMAPTISAFAGHANLRAWDTRIGQISILARADSDEDALNATLADCKQKTRNLVRKGMKANFDIERSTGSDDWDRLALLHRLGIERMGGRYKSEREFHALREKFEPHGGCRLYVARRDGEFAGGLLNLYHGNWVEYFTPVSDERFRNEQVLSAIIARALQDARREGYMYWNWGGTWPSQDGVYRFKNGWGAHDHRYSYYGSVYDNGLNQADPVTLLANFPYFFVRPFLTSNVANPRTAEEDR
jgi:Acetyltransferase (GNAT) domain